MKKILILVLIVLFGLMSYNLFTKSFAVGKIQIKGIQDIKTDSDKLSTEIEEANSSIYTLNTKKTEDLEKKKINLLIAKQDYFDLVENSSEEEIKEAKNEEKYTIEYLWARIGNYATKQGVVVKLELVKSSINTNAYKLNFTVDGPYIGVLNFVYDIENDPELGFKIDAFEMVTGTESEVTATFSCDSIGIDKNSLKQVNSTQTKTVDDKQDTSENTVTSDTKSENKVSQEGS